MHSLLDLLKSDSFVADVGSYSSPYSLLKILEKNPLVLSIRKAFQEEKLLYGDFHHFSTSFHPDRQELAMAAIAVALSESDDSFAKDYIENLAGTHLQGLEYATRIARIYSPVRRHPSTWKPPDSRCFVVLQVLREVWGKPWNDLTKNLLVSLRPSAVREVWDEVKSDSMSWRVTVFLEGEKDSPTVRSIEQEAEAGAVGVLSGKDLMDKALALIPIKPAGVRNL